MRNVQDLFLRQYFVWGPMRGSGVSGKGANKIFIHIQHIAMLYSSGFWMLKYTECFFIGPALKVLSMELVPPNKEK